MAYLLFDSTSAAQKAFAYVNGKLLDGKKVALEYGTEGQVNPFRNVGGVVQGGMLYLQLLITICLLCW